MHVPDGVVSGPINAATYVISAGVCFAAIRRAKTSLEEKDVPILGVTAAFIFAAQMLNFPVAGGTSGHFLGALLAAILLGPLMSCLVMSIVLLIQCLGFADGGLTALGTNIFNMGIVGAIAGYGVFLVVRSVAPKTRAGFLAAAAIAAWFSVEGGALCCSLELAWSGTSPLKVVLPAMLGVHALIGVGEALITASVLSLVLATRPDLVHAWRQTLSPSNAVAGTEA